mmetsp:Transcript_78179/g.147591  ORF Transcript_78179/g.147591 Transcript_78179/m.147591 type:complete len:253 (-) Transcript_78179:732-1490(-)
MRSAMKPSFSSLLCTRLIQSCNNLVLSSSSSKVRRFLPVGPIKTFVFFLSPPRDRLLVYLIDCDFSLKDELNEFSPDLPMEGCPPSLGFLLSTSVIGKASVSSLSCISCVLNCSTRLPLMEMMALPVFTFSCAASPPTFEMMGAQPLSSENSRPKGRESNVTLGRKFFRKPFTNFASPPLALTNSSMKFMSLLIFIFSPSMQRTFEGMLSISSMSSSQNPISPVPTSTMYVTSSTSTRGRFPKKSWIQGFTW